jgi:hypothetical protein
MIEPGDVVPLRLAITDPANGSPVDAGTVTLEITDPTGAVVTLTGASTPPVQHTAASGVYLVSWPVPAVYGTYRYRWIATGANAGVWPDVFTVESPEGVFVSTAEALAHLRATTVITRAADVEELRRLIRVACDAVERDLGRIIAPRTVTETYSGGGAAIVLARSPVIAITSVTDNGSTLTAGTDYTFDSRVGIIYRGGPQSPTRFTTGRGTVAVTYRAGYQQPPWIARQVALRGVQRMWQQSQQMPHPALDDLGADGQLFTPAGVLTPLEMAAYDKLRQLAIA